MSPLLAMLALAAGLGWALARPGSRAEALAFGLMLGLLFSFAVSA
jgi:hypothetical protein